MLKSLQNFEKPIVVNNIPVKGLDVSFSFDTDELKYINENRMPEDMDILSFNTNINFNYLPGGEKILRLSGNMDFKLSTFCGISLQPVELDMSETVEIDFSETVNTDEQTDETYLLPEIIENGTIDVYDVMVGELILSLPSYVAKEGADLSDLDYTPNKIDLQAQKDPKKNPFEVLKNLKVDK